MKKYTLEDLEAYLFIFFQYLTDSAKKIRIPLKVLVNVALLTQFTAQALQIYFLHQAGRSLIGMCLLTIPTMLTSLYFLWVVKTSRKRPVSLDFMRKFATLFAIVVVLNLILDCVLALSLRPSYFIEEKSSLRSEIAYASASIAFLSFMYLVSCKQDVLIIRNRKRLN